MYYYYPSFFFNLSPTFKIDSDDGPNTYRRHEASSKQGPGWPFGHNPRRLNCRVRSRNNSKAAGSGCIGRQAITQAGQMGHRCEIRSGVYFAGAIPIA